MHRYFCVNKPYDMVSQFVSPDKVRVLGDIDFPFPEGIHAIGRLDSHSEGLLLLTTDKRVTKLLFQGKVPHERTYLVRVNRIVTQESLHRLRTGVEIIVEQGALYMTPPCKVDIVQRPPNLYPGVLPSRPDIPSTWLEITLTEGKFHQVRKMVQAISHPCRRLIRISIEDMKLGGLLPGQVREYSDEEFFRLLRIDDY